MNRFIILLLCLASISFTYGQEKQTSLNQSPYAMFGDNTPTLQTNHELSAEYILSVPLIENDTQIGHLNLDMQKGIAYVISTDGQLLIEKELTEEQKARFTSMDPHAENYYSISPYAYCANNPLRFTDPTGMVIDSASMNDWNNQRSTILDRLADLSVF